MHDSVSLRIGIDVGGTNTDAVLMAGTAVLATHKTPTTPDTTTGIANALKIILTETKIAPEAISAVMFGTTHFINAVVERQRLTPVAAVRLGLPATSALPPMVDWPDDLRQALGNCSYLAHGGYEFDGREISRLDDTELYAIAADIRDRGIRSIALSSVFSLVNPQLEESAADLLCAEIPQASITRSHEIGRIGLLERENAAILNACLHDLATQIVHAFSTALHDLAIHAPFYLSQNDGTLMNAAFAEKYPVFTFASGATNSMRGAAFLSGIKEAMVVDIGGTTTDVGMLMQGLPREASVVVNVGGVRTNFRMPDVYSFGLGGGSRIHHQDGRLRVGPDSVGYALQEQALVFGGTTLTATDIAVAQGGAEIGDTSAVQALDRQLVNDTVDNIHEQVAVAVDRMKTSAAAIPVIIVGGGSILIDRSLLGTTELIKPPHFAVANAVGAAIAQVGGETDRIFSLEKTSREEALADARSEATQKAIEAGADGASVQIVDVEEVPLAYLPSSATRIRVKAVGDLVH